jgi:hypothetical protein
MAKNRRAKHGANQRTKRPDAASADHGSLKKPDLAPETKGSPPGGIANLPESAQGSADSMRADQAERFRRIGLGSLTALLVAAPLIPSESLGEIATGSVLTLASVTLVVASLAGCVLFSSRSLRLDWPDLLVVLLLAVVVVSAGWMAGLGNIRATINAAWQWVNFGLLYLLARQLVVSGVERRALCLVMIALATGLSALAVHQVFVTMPRLVARYHEDPETVLREAGVDAPADSPERRLFRDRLESMQPTATFALTNSLAGFVAPWLILTVGVAGQLWQACPERKKQWIMSLLCCLALGFCILLTRSRTATLASLLGLVALGGWHVRGPHRWDWRVLTAVSVLFLLLVLGVTVAGVFDWLVVIEAPKSLMYRVEYWQSTLAMIADHPWLGCGPGNFQQYYPFYKLPQASETIADPHNFLLEVWSTIGTPGLLIFVVFLALVVWRCVSTETSTEHTVPEPDATEPNCRAIWIGGLTGAMASLPIGMAVGFPPSLDLFWLGLPISVVVIVVLRPWCTNGRLPHRLLLIAMIVLLVNLSAAGGIGFGGVATSFWLLAALIVNATPHGHRSIHVGRHGMILLAALGLVVLAACHQTLYSPVLASQTKISEAVASGQRGRLERAETLLKQAIAADPFASQPWFHLAGVYHRRLLSGGPSEASDLRSRFDQAIRQAERRNARSFALQRQVGDWHLDLYRCFRDPELLEIALQAYRRWTELYPNSNMAHAQLAWTYHLVGNRDDAQRHAALALRLNSLTPHQERKLSEQQIHGGDLVDATMANAEQRMQDVRKGLIP